MAMLGFGQQQADQVRALRADVKTLLLQQLKDACKLEKLPVSGNKALLQSRLIQHIDDAQLSNSAFQLHSIKNSIGGIESTGVDSNVYPSPYPGYTSALSTSPSHRALNPKMSGYGSSFGTASNQRHSSGRPRFRDSPFYTIIKPLTEVAECKIRETTRDTARLKIQLAPDVTAQIQSDSNVRVMVFCASESHTFQHQPQDISFPHQVELKCNDLDVKVNLRGLKNKPGSTRPADITSMLQRKIPFANNVLEMIYALTNKGPLQKFYLVVNLVAKKPVEGLVADLRNGKSVSKDRVLSEMRSKASDPDIVATSTVMSLKCPLSYMRIQTPCRGSGCSHNQCFDATSYLQLQEQAPTWTCPVCNKSVMWENLVLDHYVSGILSSTSKDTEQVTIEPDGRWHVQGQDTDNNGTISRASRPSNPTPSDDDDDDDLIEIRDTSVPYRTQAQPKTLTPTPSSIRTPSINSRAASSTPMVGGSTSRKRPHSDVIDLTLSEDEEPVRPVKSRPSMSSIDGGIGSGSYRTGPPEYPSQLQQAASSQRYQFQLPPLSPPQGFDFYSRKGNGVNGGAGF